MTDDDIPIIDAHHHFWDLSLGAQEWLCRPPWIAFRYGDYEAIRRNFLPTHYKRVSAEHNVVATVTMEAEWDEALLLEETRWTESLHEIAPRFPVAHVARTFLHRPDAPEQIAAHAAFPFVRGLRHKPTVAASREHIETGALGGMTCPKWRRGYAALAPNKLHFELQAPWWHVDELLDLVSAYPDTPVVIVHCFMPADRSAEALAGWRTALRRAASAPQISMKISGFGIKGVGWPFEQQRPIVRDVIEAFGVDRCLFASNFPVDGLTGSFDTLYSGFKAATADLPMADRLKLFHDNAVRTYRLDIPLIAA
ncbi:MAG: amidohydrolase family protein [Hyphomicrobiaceae bacterium]